MSECEPLVLGLFLRETVLRVAPTATCIVCAAFDAMRAEVCWCRLTLSNPR